MPSQISCATRAKKISCFILWAISIHAPLRKKEKAEKFQSLGSPTPNFVFESQESLIKEMPRLWLPLRLCWVSITRQLKTRFCAFAVFRIIWSWCARFAAFGTITIRLPQIHFQRKPPLEQFLAQQFSLWAAWTKGFIIPYSSALLRNTMCVRLCYTEPIRTPYNTRFVERKPLFLWLRIYLMRLLVHRKTRTQA